MKGLFICSVVIIIKKLKCLIQLLLLKACNFCSSFPHDVYQSLNSPTQYLGNRNKSRCYKNSKDYNDVTLCILKSRQVYFKQTQLIGGTFPRHFLKKSKQKSKQWHTTRKRTSPNSGCQKRNCLEKVPAQCWVNLQ